MPNIKELFKNLEEQELAALARHGQIPDIILDGDVNPEIADLLDLVSAENDEENIDHDSHARRISNLLESMGPIESARFWRILLLPDERETKSGRSFTIDWRTYLQLFFIREDLFKKSLASGKVTTEKLKTSAAYRLLTRLLEGEEPNKVFGWKAHRGRPKGMDLIGRKLACKRIQNRVIELKERYGDQVPIKDRAIEDVAEELNVTAKTLRSWWKEIQGHDADTERS